MMRMVHAGGIEPLTDGVRAADPDNPLGYFEFEAVKRTREDPSWLAAAPGRAVKMVHVLLRDLPPTYRYRVVMMHRDLDEVVASQEKMLARSGRPGARMAPADLKRVFASQMRAVEQWAASQPNFSVLDVSYNDIVADPAGQAGRVAAFLGLPEARVGLMAAAVEPGLYRNRRPS